MYILWLSTGMQRDKHKFVTARTDARRAITIAKEEWFMQKAEEAERGRHNGKMLWRCIRDIQRGRRGMVPVRYNMVKDEEGNIQSQFSLDELSAVRQRPIRTEMDKLPSIEELYCAVDRIGNG